MPLSDGATLVLSICMDCLYAAMSDEWPEDERVAQTVRDGFTELATDGYDLPVMTAEEGYFSWSPCDCCKSPLGGDRWDAVSFPIPTTNA